MSGDSLTTEQQIFQFEGGGAIPTSPLQLLLREISAKTASELNLRWHSRLPNIHWSCIVRNTYYICYGVFYNQECIGVCIWSSPVAQNRFKNGKYILELRRMALSDKCPKNTASRILSIMVKLIRKKFPKIMRLISYQDTDVHKGTIYKASGWKQGAETNFISWSSRNPTHNPDQSTAKKIRWELNFNQGGNNPFGN